MQPIGFGKFLFFNSTFSFVMVLIIGAGVRYLTLRGQEVTYNTSHPNNIEVETGSISTNSNPFGDYSIWCFTWNIIRLM